MIKVIRNHVGIKLFISYFIVVIAVLAVLALVVELSLPTTFNTHLMPTMGIENDSSLGGNMMNMYGNSGGGKAIELVFNGFQNSVNLALLWSGIAALISAVVVSVIASNWIVSPIREMTKASQHIAEGQYDQRVKVNKKSKDELFQLAENFNRMAEKLSETELMRQQLIGDVSHELRTPLTAIQGSMEGLIDGVIPNTARTFGQINKEVKRLKILVDDLQNLSRIEANIIDLNLTSINITECISEVVQRLQFQFDEKDVTLQMVFDSDIPEINIDSNRINQVLVNLIGNALHYTENGGKVEILVKRMSEELIVSISDTGVGIPKEHLTKIFTRFYRVDKSRSRVGGGSGIGLTIAKHLVKSHGGRIWAESNGEGQGSKFSFSIPINGK